MLPQDNLFPDIEAWKGRGLTMASMDRLLEQKPENDVLKLILIKDNQVGHEWLIQIGLLNSLAPGQRCVAEICSRLSNK
jgi:hypothetical protein